MHRQPLVKPPEHRLITENMLRNGDIEKAHGDPAGRHALAVRFYCGLGRRDQSLSVGMGYLRVEGCPALSL